MREVYMSVASGEVNTPASRSYELKLRNRGMFVSTILQRAPHKLSRPFPFNLAEAQTRDMLHAERLKNLDGWFKNPLGGKFGGAVLMLAAPLNPDHYDFDESMHRDLRAMYDTARIANDHGLPVFTVRYPRVEEEALDRMHTSHLHTDEALAALESVTQSLQHRLEMGPILEAVTRQVPHAA